MTTTAAAAAATPSIASCATTTTASVVICTAASSNTKNINHDANDKERARSSATKNGGGTAITLSPSPLTKPLDQRVWELMLHQRFVVLPIIAAAAALQQQTTAGTNIGDTKKVMIVGNSCTQKQSKSIKAGGLLLLFGRVQNNSSDLLLNQLVLIRGSDHKNNTNNEKQQQQQQRHQSIVRTCQELSISYCVATTEHLNMEMKRMSLQITGRSNVQAIGLLLMKPHDEDSEAPRAGVVDEAAAPSAVLQRQQQPPPPPPPGVDETAKNVAVRQLQEECQQVAVMQAGGGLSDTLECAVSEFYHRHYQQQQQHEPAVSKPPQIEQQPQPQPLVVAVAGSALVLPMVRARKASRRALFVLLDQRHVRELTAMAWQCLSKQIPFFWIREDWTRRVGDMLDVVAVDTTTIADDANANTWTTADAICLAQSLANVGDDAYRADLSALLELIAESKEQAAVQQQRRQPSDLACEDCDEQGATASAGVFELEGREADLNQRQGGDCEMAGGGDIANNNERSLLSMVEEGDDVDDDELALAGDGFCEVVKCATAEFFRMHSKRLLTSTGRDAVHLLVLNNKHGLLLLRRSDMNVEEVRELAYQCYFKNIRFLWIGEWNRIKDMVGVDPASTNAVFLSLGISDEESVVFHAEMRDLNDAFNSLLRLIDESKKVTSNAADSTVAEFNSMETEHPPLPSDDLERSEQDRDACREPASKRQKIQGQDAVSDAVVVQVNSNYVDKLLIPSHQDASILPTSSGSGDDGDGIASIEFMNNADMLRVEEEIALLATSVDLLNTRRAEVDRGIASAQLEESHLLRQVGVWQGRVEQIAETQQKQEALQQRLKLSIAHCKARLQRLTASDVTAEEIEEIAASQSVNVDIVNDVIGACASPSYPTMLEEEKDEVDLGTAPVFGDDENIAVPPMSAAPSTAASETKMSKDAVLGKSFFPTEEHCVMLSMPDIHMFWDVRKDEQMAEYAFLDCITTESRLKSILAVLSQEALSLDTLDPSGQHRRESMWNTCIDACLMANPGLKMHAAFHTAPLVSDAPNSRFDPNVPLCPFELSGVCADPDCSYQHLEKRVFGSVLPRELVPLPKLRLYDVYRGAAQRSSDNPTLVIDRGDSGSSKEAVAQAADADEHEAILNNDDFITLPKADENQRINDANNNECIGEGFDRLLSVSGESPVWWMDTSTLNALRELTRSASISAILDAFGVVLTAKKTKAFLRFRYCDQATTTIDGCRYAGMLIDCTRLAVHAGRFDVSHTLFVIASQIFTRYTKNPENTTLDAFSSIFSSLCMTLLETSGFEAYAFDKSRKNSFLLAFDSQVKMALASFCFDQLYQFQKNCPETLSYEAFHLWCFASPTIKKGIWVKRANLPRDQISAAILSECTMEDEVTASDHVHRTRAEGLLNSVRVANQLRTGISEITSTRVLVDVIMYPSLNAVRKMFRLALAKDESPTRVVLKGVILLSYVVFGALESAANQLRTDEQAGGPNSDLRELHSVIDKMLVELRAISSSLPMMDLLLSPVFAANIALAVSLKIYDTAYYRLESTLGNLTIAKYADHPGTIGRALAPYSELLWSQLVQLRASLPTRSTGATAVQGSMSLSKEIDDDHAAICKCVSALGVFPHHVGLSNDWNIINVLRSSSILCTKKIMQKKKLELGKTLAFYYACLPLHQMLTEGTNADLKFNFGKNKLSLRGSFTEIKSAIPQSLLLAGSSMIELDLSCTGLRRLPLHFGLHFPRLVRLELSGNILDELPTTMDRLLALRELYIGENKLSWLPSSFALPNLSLLYAQKNRLTELPPSVKDCTKLVRLNLAENPVGSAFWSLVAQLPNLLGLQPQS